MENRKNIILVGDTEDVSKGLFEEVKAKFPEAVLHFYQDWKALLRQQKSGKPSLVTTDETLLMLNIADVQILQETLQAIAADKRLSLLPCLVLLQKIDSQLLRFCYEKFISGAILIPEDADRQTVHFVLEKTLHFWLRIASLPKHQPENNQSARKNLLISDGIESKLKVSLN